jgi:hypothetical protein
MSTKTTFKRVALVAVAALGLGVLSVAPSSATVGTQSITVTNGTSTTALNYDSTTGATFSWSARMDQGDTVTVNVAPKSIPAGADANIAQLRYLDSTSAANSFLGTIAAAGPNVALGNQAALLDTVTAAGTFSIRTSGSGFVGADFRVELDSTTARTAGTYTFTVTTKVYNAGSATATTTTDTDVSIVVSAVASESKVASAATSTAVLNAGSTTGSATDSVVAAVATANGTQVANIVVTLKNAAGGGSARESITATLTGAGLISPDNSTFGKSFVIAPSASETTIRVRADGTAGTGTITISTPSVSFGAKTVVFYAKAAKTVTAATNKPVIAASANTAVVYAQAVDANGAAWGGAAYIYAASAADALIAGSETPVACTYVVSDNVHACPVTGKLPGTANFKVIDAATVALATATSNSVAVKVSTGTPATAKLAFDKATYAPGEKAQIWVTALDAAGNALPEQTISNIFAAGGITSSTAFSAGSDTVTATFADIAGATSATSGTVAGYKVYTVYMPMSSGDVKISATGGTGLAAAGRVAVSATASVVNSSVDAATDAANEATDAANAATDAALAAADAADAATAAAQDASDAVAALSASVSKLISSLRAQITSLTNLVIKIQKKVRA